MAFYPIEIFTDGVIREARISRQALKKEYTSSLSLAWNIDLSYKNGSISVRKGSRAIGSNPVSNKPTLGTGVLDSIQYNRPYGVWDDSGAKLYHYANSIWNLSSGFPSTVTDYDFTQLGGNLYAISRSTQMVVSQDGLTNFTGSTDFGAFPLSGGVTWTMGSRVFVSDVPNKPGYVYFSSIYNPEGNDGVSTKHITWNTNPVAGDILVINPDDGAGRVVGGVFTGNTYLIFKERSAYMYRKAQTGVEPDAYLSQGAANKDAYTSCQGFAFFYSAPIPGGTVNESGGFYKTNGQKVQDIGWEIQDVIDSIEDPSDVRVVADEFTVYLHLGNIAVDDVIYANAIFRYHVVNDLWDGPHSYPYDDMHFYRSSTFGIVAQHTNGIVQLNTNDKDDNGTQIDFSAVSNVHQMEEEIYLKTIESLTIYSSNAFNTNLTIYPSLRTKPQLSNPSHPISNFSQYIERPVSSQLNSFYYRWSGTKQYDDMALEGLVLSYQIKSTV